MFIGHFTEQPWQDQKTGIMGTNVNTTDLNISNSLYDPEIGAHLYNRYIDEKVYAEEVGFDGVMFNEHHSTPFCMQGVTNVGVAITARVTKRVKLCVLGNILPLWEDPLWLAEQLAMIDMISHGRLVPGIVRGGGRESFSHNAPPVYNRERWQEAHDFIVKTWTTPGPFRWEGKHYQYRYVNPWAVPLQKPYPQIWVPCSVSPETAVWTAKHRYPMVMLATALPATKQMFDVYRDAAAEQGYEAKTQNFGYLFKVHVEDTEEMAEAAARRYLGGVANPFLAGNEGVVKPWLMNPPGITSRAAAQQRTATQAEAQRAQPAGRGGAGRLPYEVQVERLTIVAGTPKSVMPKIKHILETLRPGTIFFWDGDGGMTHEDSTRSMTHMGKEVIPAARELGKEMGLVSSFDVNDGTGHPQVNIPLP
jgi:alkanesulfonate monooxygenase SsuD/methylene tetrahydromethanopterin reductase-like flavin-dependent oxidoreductase (luciferase family)